ncbi:MAG: hypothetical protein ACLRTZ_00035 [Agathobacter sp.]
METYHSNMARRWVLSLQREGRIIRQGNHNKKVHIFRYVTESTFDSYMWQLIENKQKFISQIMTSKAPVQKLRRCRRSGTFLCRGQSSCNRKSGSKREDGIGC